MEVNEKTIPLPDCVEYDPETDNYKPKKKNV